MYNRLNIISTNSNKSNIRSHQDRQREGRPPENDRPINAIFRPSERLILPIEGFIVPSVQARQGFPVDLREPISETENHPDSPPP